MPGLNDWSSGGAPDEDRGLAVKRILAAWREATPTLNLAGLGLRSFPFRPDDFPFVNEIRISGNPWLADLSFEWAHRIGDILFFLNDLESTDTLGAWADEMARSVSARSMRIGIMANVNYGHRLRLGELPDLAPETAQAQAVHRFGLALSCALELNERIKFCANSLLTGLPPETKFVAVGARLIQRSDIEGLASGALPLDESTIRARAAQTKALGAVMQFINRGWAPNAHMSGLVERGAALLSLIRQRSRAHVREFDDTCKDIKAVLHDDPAALAGLAWAEIQTQPVAEGGLVTDTQEVIPYVWAYCTRHRDEALRPQLIAAFANRLRDIGEERPCATGNVQRLLQVPEGIDTSLMTTLPDHKALEEEMTRIVASLNDHLDAQIEPQSAPDNDNPHSAAEAALRFKLRTAMSLIEHSFIDLRGLPDDLVRKACAKPLDGLELNELMMADMKLADLSTDYRDGAGLTALQKAVWVGDAEAVRAQIDKGADPNLRVPNSFHPGYGFPLYHAAAQGKLEVLDVLLEAERLNADQCGIEGWTALMIASSAGEIEAVKRLINSGRGDVNRADINGWTPLLLACGQGHTEIARLLIECERVDVNRARNNGVTPLMLAARSSHTEILEALLGAEGIEVNARNDLGLNALMLAAKHSSARIVTRLIECGADVNCTDHKNGATALMLAASEGHIDTLRALLAAPGLHADIREKNYGFNALMYAAGNNNADVARVLLESGKIDIKARDHTGATARRIARQLQHWEIVYLLSAQPGYDSEPGRLGLGQLIQFGHGLKGRLSRN